MTHDSVSKQGPSLPVPTQEHLVACVSQSCQALMPRKKRRGRPPRLSDLHLCLGVLLCGLRGFGPQLAFWRLLSVEPIGSFEPVHLGDQAVSNRLARAAGLMEQLF